MKWLMSVRILWMLDRYLMHALHAYMRCFYTHTHTYIYMRANPTSFVSCVDLCGETEAPLLVMTET